MDTGDPSGRQLKRPHEQETNNKEEKSGKKAKITQEKCHDLEKSLPGVIFQVQLLRLYVFRGKEKHKYFRLYKELPEADKFNDIVYAYGADENALVWSFLQAKHTKKEITIEELKSENIRKPNEIGSEAKDKKPFSLVKYFASFCKIKRSKTFEDKELKRFVIVTNTKLAFGESAKNGESFEEGKLIFVKSKLNEENILHFDQACEIRLKDTKNGSTKNEMKEVLQSAYERKIKKESQKVEDLLQKSLLIKDDLKKKLLEKQFVGKHCLLYKVLQSENTLFKKKKISKTNLIEVCEVILPILGQDDSLKKNLQAYSNGGRRKNELQEEAKTALRALVERKSTDDIKNWLIKTKSDSPEDFEFAFKNFDSYITEFLEKFRFVVNYPDEVELGKHIKEESKENYKDFDKNIEFLTGLSDSADQTEKLNWLKSSQSNCVVWKNGVLYEVPKESTRTNLTNDERCKEVEIQDYLGSLCCNIGKSRLSALRLEKLQDFGIKFVKLNLRNLENFLKSKKTRFYLKTEGTALSAIKIYQILRRSEFKNMDHFFILISDLLIEKRKERVLQVLEIHKNRTILVVECDDKMTDDLTSPLLNTLERKNEMKIVFITQGDDFSVASEFEKDETCFSDLDEESQNKILRKQIKLQGREEKVSLGALISKKSAEKILDHRTLSSLLEEEISVGDKKEFSSNKYYIPRRLYYQKIKTDFLEENINSTMIYITGATERDLNLNPENSWSRKNEEIIYMPCKMEKNDWHNPSKQLFKTKNCYWLAYRDSKLFWVDSEGDTSAIQKYTEKCYNPYENVETIQPRDIKKKIVIVANDPGFGKTTFLTELANQFKKNDPGLWTVRICLYDYRTDLKEKFEENDTENDIKKAIEFVSKVAIPDDSDNRTIQDDSDNRTIQFQKNLFEEGLKPSENGHDRKPKIVILLDGFDEICPTFRSHTTKFIKALKKSSVYQLWVTTRMHEKVHLEKELETPAYLLYPLTKYEQIDFLNKLWTHKLLLLNEKDDQKASKKIDDYFNILEEEINLNPWSLDILENKEVLNDENLKRKRREKDVTFLRNFITSGKLNFSEYAKVMLENWGESITPSLEEQEKFSCTPLHLEMLGDVIFEEKFLKYENFDIGNIYHKFTEKKIEIFAREKRNISEDNPAARKKVEEYKKIAREDHRNLAYKYFFTDAIISRKLEEEDLARIGLVVINNKEPELEKNYKPEFVHLSFGEYFLSKYLVWNLSEQHVQKILLEEILVEERYDLTRKFFNDQLDVTKSSEFQGVIEKSVMDANTNELTADKGAYKDIAEILLKRFKNNPETFKNLLLQKFDDTNCEFGLRGAENKEERITTLAKWIKGIFQEGELENGDFSDLLYEKNYEVIDCMLNTGIVPVKNLIDSDIRDKLDPDNFDDWDSDSDNDNDNDNDNDYDSDSDSYYNTDTSDEWEAAYWRNERHDRYTQKWKSRSKYNVFESDLKPIMNKLKGLSEKLSPFSSRKINDFVEWIEGNFRDPDGDS